MKKFKQCVMVSAIAAATLASVNAFGSEKTVKIIGGQDATPNTYPWMSSLQIKDDNEHICGASLISDSLAITAAHCVAGTDATDLQLVVSEYNLVDEADTGKKVDVAQIYIHPDYNQDNSDNDIALVQLAAPVTNAPISIISHERLAALADGTALTVMGWGVTSIDSDAIPDKLQEANVNLSNNNICNATMVEEFDEVDPITDNMLCAAVDDSGKDACYGDSGGPLVYKLDGQFYQVGVVSFGAECAEPGRYGVYTKVDNYMDWINEAIAGRPVGADADEFWQDEFDAEWEYVDEDGFPCERKRRSREEDLIDNLYDVIGYLENSLEDGLEESVWFDPSCEAEPSMYTGLDIPSDLLLLAENADPLTKEVVISNYTQAPLTIYDLDLESDESFELGEESCIGETLQEDEQCTVNIIYSSVENSSSSVELLINSDDDETAAIILTGAQVKPLASGPQENLALFTGGDIPWSYDAETNQLTVSGGAYGELGILSAKFTGPGLLQYESLVTGGADSHYLVFGVDGESVYETDEEDENNADEIYLSEGEHTIYWMLVADDENTQPVSATVSGIHFINEAEMDNCDKCDRDEEVLADDTDTSTAENSTRPTLGEKVGLVVDDVTDKSAAGGSCGIPLIAALALLGLVRRKF